MANQIKIILVYPSYTACWQLPVMRSWQSAIGHYTVVVIPYKVLKLFNFKDKYYNISI